MSETAAQAMQHVDQVPGDQDKEGLSEVRPIPRITIQAFCETDTIRQTLEMASGDRRMSRAHVSVNMGGIAGATDYYGSAPTPNLIIIESRKSGDELMAELGGLADVCDSTTKVIVIGHLNDILMYRQLVSNGISEYLVAPVSMADVMMAISDIFSSEENGPLGKMIAFIGAKGGAGSSTICHNVAWQVSSVYNNEVVLADLDLAFGTANMNLDQDPTQGIADAVFSPDRVDDILLDRLLAKCAKHLSLLAAPSTLERTYDFDAQAFSSILEVAQRGAPCVVVDLPNQWNGWTKQVLAAADEVVLTAEPELANLRNAKNLADTLVEIRPNDTPPRLVMNKVGMQKRPEISVSDFAGAIGLEPSVIIPFDPGLFGLAANNGQMISEADAKSPIAETMMNLSQIVTGRAEIKNEKKSAFGFLKGLTRKK
ncbi:MAG: CpaE family protein [Rhizobiaceae bacterium]|jgi:pilus assembly protein CpaE|nr:CpaE family protein [Rhizobiaceae bacterium]